MSPPEKWATVSFDVLIVCVLVCVKFTPLKLRLIGGTKASVTERKWRWWKRHKELNMWMKRVPL